MKLKLGHGVMSRTKRFFQPEAREFGRAGALIRRGALRAAIRCSKLGSNTDLQFEESLKEFLAFFCVIVVNEIAIKSGRQSEDELTGIYRKLVDMVCEGHEPDDSLLEYQATISRLVHDKDAAFDHWFYGYWNADFAGMRITAHDLADLEQKKIAGPTGRHCADAGLILLARIARLENAQLSIPEPAHILKYDIAIQEAVASFVRSLAEVFNPTAKKQT